jgi:hypothetical protein
MQDVSLVMPGCIYPHPNSLINGNPNYARKKSMTKNYISMATNDTSLPYLYDCKLNITIFSLALIRRPAAINLQKDA